MTTEQTAHATQTAAEAVTTETPSTEAQTPATQTQATTETKAVEAKAEEIKPTEAPAKVIPEKYEFQVPDGSLLTKEEIIKAEAFAKEKGMSQEEAQVYLQGEHEKFQQVFEARKAAFDQQVESWKKESMNDPEIGGDNFAKNMEFAKRAIEKHGSPEMIELLNQTGLGNHRSFVKFFAKYGAEFADDQAVAPNAHGTIEDRMARLYPTMIKN